MVSAVFHQPIDLPARSPATTISPADASRNAPADAVPASTNESVTAASTLPLLHFAKQSRTDTPIASRELWLKVIPPVVGLALLVGVWGLVSIKGQIPSPLQTWDQAVQVFSDPFYRNGPNDQGIGWNVLQSLQRVGLGFGLAALVGIPLGFIIGRFTFVNRMFGPIISLLRPVSPLAWLPIGLLVFRSANPAAIWTIFICSIWPMIINTAVGVQRVPQDYLNVARVLSLSEWKVMTRILLPAVLPYMLTGVRLAIGTAWLVIVAAEMLTGGVGIGFWVWDEWNNLNVKNIIIAIFVIGFVGLVLEWLLLSIARTFTYEDVKQ
jgi:nitrate/nitrite transport system permease protein